MKERKKGKEREARREGGKRFHRSKEDEDSKEALGFGN